MSNKLAATFHPSFTDHWPNSIGQPARLTLGSVLLPVWACSVCGGIVIDPVLHREWHKEKQ